MDINQTVRTQGYDETEKCMWEVDGGSEPGEELTVQANTMPPRENIHRQDLWIRPLKPSA